MRYWPCSEIKLNPVASSEVFITLKIVKMKIIQNTLSQYLHLWYIHTLMVIICIAVGSSCSDGGPHIAHVITDAKATVHAQANSRALQDADTAKSEVDLKERNQKNLLKLMESNLQANFEEIFEIIAKVFQQAKQKPLISAICDHYLKYIPELFRILNVSNDVSNVDQTSMMALLQRDWPWVSPIIMDALASHIKDAFIEFQRAHGQEKMKAVSCYDSITEEFKETLLFQRDSACLGAYKLTFEIQKVFNLECKFLKFYVKDYQKGRVFEEDVAQLQQAAMHVEENIPQLAPLLRQHFQKYHNTHSKSIQQDGSSSERKIYDACIAMSLGLATSKECQQLAEFGKENFEFLNKLNSAKRFLRQKNVLAIKSSLKILSCSS